MESTLKTTVLQDTTQSNMELVDDKSSTLQDLSAISNACDLINTIEKQSINPADIIRCLFNMIDKIESEQTDGNNKAY